MINKEDFLQYVRHGGQPPGRTPVGRNDTIMRYFSIEQYVLEDALATVAEEEEEEEGGSEARELSPGAQGVEGEREKQGHADWIKAHRLTLQLPPQPLSR